ncbi:unnamed protein product [Peronospora destructor]|uniref:C2H2-type domain-containing protein n=1 Tax=Peronospora destructor TaxID=86335 RepID=A0AAV0TK79_9STRA|nr:unnamed protein product [Peronospora destructor]
MTQAEETRPFSPSSTDMLIEEKHSWSVSPLLSKFGRRILTVGDGNFSYSLALAKQHKSRDGTSNIQLTATSYDTYDELVTKYPESKRICAQLNKLGATVLHRVDATNIRESLVAAGAELKLRFDSVVFNHPHCGEENIRRHQSLISHFYASALEVLEEEEEDDHSGILLTLAEGQSERWQAVQRALGAGLTLYRQVDDVDNDDQFGVVYERKRHQNGKSFHQVTLYGERTKQASTLFIFRRQKDDVDTISATGTAAFTMAGKKKMMTTTTSRKRKTENELRLELACTQCEKSFKSAQGLKTHVHMVHELEASGALMKVLLCKFCDRTFKKEDARRQHQLAKHGNDPLIKPDWFETRQTISWRSDASAASSASVKDVPSAATTTRTIATLEPKTCLICEHSFATVADFDAHWQKLQPRAAATRICSSCNREFDEERALRQHRNFCNQKVTQ